MNENRRLAVRGWCSLFKKPLLEQSGCRAQLLCLWHVALDLSMSWLLPTCVDTLTIKHWIHLIHTCMITHRQAITHAAGSTKCTTSSNNLVPAWCHPQETCTKTLNTKLFLYCTDSHHEKKNRDRASRLVLDFEKNVWCVWSFDAYSGNGPRWADHYVTLLWDEETG